MVVMLAVEPGDVKKKKKKKKDYLCKWMVVDTDGQMVCVWTHCMWWKARCIRGR